VKTDHFANLIPPMVERFMEVYEGGFELSPPAAE